MGLLVQLTSFSVACYFCGGEVHFKSYECKCGVF
jgi:hypothetical protein